MRFLVDECTGSKVAQYLREANYEVFSVFDEARGMSDDEVLTKAFVENWILITNDKDFGEMIFRERRTYHGIVFLRLEDERAANKIKVLEQLLENYHRKIARTICHRDRNKSANCRNIIFTKILPVMKEKFGVGYSMMKIVIMKLVKSFSEILFPFSVAAN